MIATRILEPTPTIPGAPSHSPPDTRYARSAGPRAWPLTAEFQKVGDGHSGVSAGSSQFAVCSRRSVASQSAA